MNYAVHVRFPGEAHYITDFITPDAPDVLTLARSKPPSDDPVEFSSCWIWQNINYPTGTVYDWHKLEAFKLSGFFQPTAIKLSAIDMWQFPAETLGWRDSWGRRWGDCEDSANLLCSLLRNWLAASDVRVALGNFRIFPHAWVQVRRDGLWETIETTLAHRLGSRDERSYGLKAYFNDKYAIELEPGFYSNLGAFIREGRKAFGAKLALLRG